MRIAVLIPDFKHLDVIEKVIAHDFSQITPMIIYYSDYKDVVKLLEKSQKNFDAILFSGMAPYNYAKRYLPRLIWWDFIDRFSGSVLRAMLEASRLNFNLNKISYDYYDQSVLSEVYEEQGMKLNVDLVLSVHDSRSMDEYIENYNQVVYKFHKENWTRKKAECCITPCYTAYRWLQQDHIPAIFVYPTADICRDTLRRMYMTYVTKQREKSSIAIVSLEIGFPNEYSMFAQHECEFLQDKVNISSLIYSFSEQLDAAVVEVTYRNYLIFTTRTILESITDSLCSFRLLKKISQNYLSRLSIGIGYGETVKEAKIHANKGLIEAKRYSKNVVFVVYSDQFIDGPIGISSDDLENNQELDDKINEKVTRVAMNAGISMQNVFKIYNIINKTNKKVFTIKELSEQMQITSRSVDRIVNKMELAGYVQVIGKQAAYVVGRPSRIIHFTLN